ncbi:V-set and immunoglobulin domain-containing protein 8b isoform X2 [Austrofundulus limnaeus]|uniref:V-set and immunoglobulin domain-containing protein 8b isoform X2 n=1 Tax=Austrofundulus limnaeus TaxID=52670 RepID=UPI0006B3A754|nr:PREDICTED: coxsackievirus and adenovirus receptor homolog isoform X2 [Austrofundulus limnaeus]
MATAKQPYQTKEEAMTITSSGPQTIQQPEGQTVTLGCTYTPGTGDTGDLDIEWSNVSPDMTQKDTLILSYSGGQTHVYDSSYSNRLKFLADPNQGDASVAISSVRLSDTGTYQCKVKKSPGVDMRKVTLVVQVPPSKTKCWVEGSEEKGGSVSLRCKSYQGTIPLTYVWTRETGGTMPNTATQDPNTGELLIKNHTDSNTGVYTCVAKNSVGQDQCKYTLGAYNPTNKAGIIAGAVIGALLLFLLLLLLIWCLISYCNKKRYQKEVSNEIRHDAPAPESKPPSRASSVRSMVGYRTHHGVQYNAVASPLPSVTESAPIVADGNNGTPSEGARGASFRYDPQYGYAV